MHKVVSLIGWNSKDNSKIGLIVFGKSIFIVKKVCFKDKIFDHLGLEANLKIIQNFF